MTDVIHLYLTGTKVVARRTSGPFWRRKIEPLAQWTWEANRPDSLTLDALEIVKKNSAKLEVVVGSALSKFMVMDLPAGLINDDEKRAVAQAHCRDQLGLSVADWCFLVELTEGAKDMPAKAIVCAIRSSVVNRVRELSLQHECRLVGLKPFVVGVWNAFEANLAVNEADPQASLLAIEEDALTLFVSHAGTLTAMRALSHNCERDLVTREMQRLSFSFGVSAEKQIYLALSENTLELAGGYSRKILRKNRYLKEGLVDDFRDILFCGGEGG